MSSHKNGIGYFEGCVCSTPFGIRDVFTNVIEEMGDLEF